VLAAEYVMNCKEVTDAPNYHFLSRSEKYTEAMRKAAVFQKLVKRHNVTDKDDSQYYMEEYVIIQIFTFLNYHILEFHASVWVYQFMSNGFTHTIFWLLQPHLKLKMY